MLKKEKLLASAQKNLLKGQIVKAIKDYEKIVEADARDVRNRQKLAELYSRNHQSEQALATYDLVARHYSDNGFLLKSLAVYKQMQKVDPERPDVYHRLAELNVKQGLKGNALTELRNLVALYRKLGEPEEAVKVLDQMKVIDPHNFGIALLVAEAFRDSGEPEKASVCLGDCLRYLAPKGDLKAVEKVRQAGLDCCPDSMSFQLEVVRALHVCGETASAMEILQEILAKQPQNAEALLLLAEGCRLIADHLAETVAYEKLLDIDADQMDWRKGYAEALLLSGAADQALEQLEKVRDTFFAAGRAADLKEIYESVQELLPDSETVVTSLQAVYENTGEGGKLFDLMSSSSDDADDARAAAVERAQSAQEVPSGELDLEGDLTQDPAQRRGPSDESKDEDATAADSESVEEPFQQSIEFDDLDLDGIEFGLQDEVESVRQATQGSPAVPDGAALAPVDVAAEIEEAGFYYQQGLLSEAIQKCQSLLERAGDCPEAEALLEKLGEAGRVSEPSGHKKKPAGVSSGSSTSQPSRGLEDRDRSRLDGSFSEFKKGLESQVSAEDTETHYNLGIAYKEMGLLDDAIEQFDKVVNDPQRRTDCLTLKGVCLVQKGAFEEAVTTFKEGLGSGDLKDCERISLYYELGLLYMAWNQPLEALDCFQCVADADPFFRNVDEQIRTLRKELGLDDDDENDESPGGGSGSDNNRVSYI